MGKRILIVVAVLLAMYLLWYSYQRHVSGAADSGAVKFDDTTAKLTEETPIPAPNAPATTSQPASGTTAVRNIVEPTVNVQPTLTGAIAPAGTIAPATDSIAPNPSNGMAFTGTGKFQVYRQGNLTWRVDTKNGHTCILFATMEEWRRPIVFQHGCGNS